MISAGIELAGRVRPRRRARGAARLAERAVSIQVVEQLDVRLAELARGESGVRLALAEALEALASRGGHFEMGFSSLEAYARERCGKSRRWASESRTLARRLAGLPALRGALVSGAIGWCMAELVARFANPESDGELTRLALGSTVRAMREYFARLKSGACQMSAASGESTESESEQFESSNRVEPEDLEMVTLSLTVSQQDAWLFEWTRRFAAHAQNVVTDEQVLAAMLAEASSTFIGALPANDQDRLADVHAKPGTLRLDLHVTRDTARFWRTLGDVMRKHLQRDMSFLAFLCECFRQEWQHLTERDEKWAHIHARDRYKCQNPVCDRHDVTCHHIVFRSAGGGDEPENLIALCTWCHLEGVHRGLIRLTRSADGTLRWVLGRDGDIVVEGRRRTREEERWAATG